MDNLYLLFKSADFYFLAPLFWVKSIEDGSIEDEELPILTYARSTDSGENTVPQYRILLENKGLCFGMEADGVMGIEEVDEERLIELREPVINKRNRCLRAVVSMNIGGEQEILAFVFNLEYIVEKEDLWNI